MTKKEMERRVYELQKENEKLKEDRLVAKVEYNQLVSLIKESGIDIQIIFKERTVADWDTGFAKHNVNVSEVILDFSKHDARVLDRYIREINGR